MVGWGARHGMAWRTYRRDQQLQRVCSRDRAALPDLVEPRHCRRDGERPNERERRKESMLIAPPPLLTIFCCGVDGVAPPSTMMPPGFPKGVVAGRSHLERLVFEGGQIIVGHVDCI